MQVKIVRHFALRKSIGRLELLAFRTDRLMGYKSTKLYCRDGSFVNESFKMSGSFMRAAKQ